ncbi:helix-turn-helix domain-containing protein [Thermomonospora umbrina]|uniref:Helix-turn-helix protein n=1 Tax=Thermomonospora umbrina TaxID=111806 RepID=A0A3D9SQM8_9ACTN|nr:helix-turn-helix transcriptional regulator [Thermomonospora umbrina]REE94894.1 helix-turn-helix protein [Thermomonospora umbrina]
MIIAEPRRDPGEQAGGGPTALRIMLGAELRRLREDSGLSREAAGERIRGSESKISRLELGKVSFKRRDIADLLAAYGLADEADPRRAALLALAARANRPGWWHRYSDVLPHWFQTYVGLEQDAELIRAYEVQFVPGLLQTRDYARAVARLGHPGAGDVEIERRVDVRMARQRVLSGDDGPRLWAVMDEAALCRPLGGRAVMRAQLRRLIEACSLPDVTLQVVPFAHGGHAAAGGAFSILRFAEDEMPDIVYLEQLTSALYMDKASDVERYLAVMERLCADADPAARTAATIERVLAEM